MSWGRYRTAVLADKPMFFYPLGMVAASVGSTPTMYRNHAPRNVGEDLVTFNGTPAAGTLTHRVGVQGFGDPFVSQANSGMQSNATTSVPSNLTMEVWVNMIATGSPADSTIFGFSPGGNPWTGLRYFNNNFEAFIGNTAGNNFDINRIPAVRGTWVHLCATYDGTSREFRFSINGVESGAKTTGSGTRDTSTSSIFIGRYNGTFDSYWPSGSGIQLVSAYDRFDPSLARRHYRAAVGGMS